MASTIKLKNGSGAPTSGQLVQGEPALDLTNKRLYTENASGTVIEVGTNPAAEITANGGIALPDNQKATFGASDDLQIYHDGSNSWIKDTGTGNLKIPTSVFQVRNVADTESLIAAADGGSAYLYYAGAQKLVTTTTGIDVTGTVTADGLTVDGNIAFSNASSSPQINSNLSIVFNVDADNNDPNDKGYFFRRHSAAENIAFFDENGDISFYEDTGTTAKFFWDASAEGLSLGGTALGKFNVSDGTNPLVVDCNATYNELQSYNRPLHINRQGNNTILNATSGNVGIGTASPAATLALDKNTATQHRVLDLENNSITYSMYVDQDNTSTNSWSLFDTTNSQTALRYLPSSSGYWQFYTNNAERLRIDSSGNVGIGTSSPALPLDVHGGTIGVTSAASFAGLQITSANTSFAYVNFGDPEDGNIGQIKYDHTTNALICVTNNAERMRIDSSGNLLVGKTSSDISVAGVELTPNDRAAFTRGGGSPILANRLTSDGEIIQLRKDGTIVGSIGSSNSSSVTYLAGSASGGGIGVANNSPAVFPARPAGVIDDTINLGSGFYRFKDLYLSGTSYHGTTSGVIWTNTSGEGVVVSNDAIQVARSGDTALLLNRMTTTGKIQVFAQAGTEVGNVTVTASATAYNTSSDYRLKENVVSMDDAASRVLALKPCRFNFIADPEKTVDGFLAHEAQEVVPEAVHGVKDELDDEGNPVYQGIDQSKLVPLLTKALQEALERIAVLESKVGA